MDNIIRDIERGATKLFVQEPDDFLYEFNSSTYVKPKLSEKIISIINTKSLPIIGKGAFGTIYSLGDNHVLKISKLCLQDGQINPNPNLQGLCDMTLNNDIVYKFENTLYNKQVVLSPNYLTEGIIGSLLQNLSKYTPSFMKINGTLLDEETNTYDNSMILISEKLLPFNVENQYQYLYYIFQICYALYIAQNRMRYVHYDLHLGNIMIRERKTNDIQKYKIGDRNLFIYSRNKYDAVIIDYGLNRCETKEHIILSRLKFNFIGSKRIDIIDNYDFNQFYDIYSMLNFILHYDKINNEYKILTGKLLSAFLRIRDDELNSFISKNSIGWRANPEELYKLTNLPMNIEEFLYYLYENYFSSYEINDIIKINDIFSKKNDNVLISSKLNLDYKNVISYYLPLDNRMNITNYPYRQFQLNKPYITQSFSIITTNSTDRIRFRRTLESFNRTNNNPSNVEQYLTMVKITQPSYQSKMEKNMFRFESSCCGMDLRTYFQNNKFKEGIAINTSFFNIFSDYEAIGFYKSNDYETNNPIPTEYKKFYGSIVIDKRTNDIDISTIDNAILNKNNYSTVITAGPVLIYDGKPLITDELLKNNSILQCRLPDPKLDADKRSKVFSDGINNCNYISQGELKHVSNQNPRSVLFLGIDIKTKVEYVCFFVIEGREKRGVGMDLSQLTQFIMSFGENENMIIKHAINLDGGSSSGITCLYGNSIYITNPNKFESYPIGPILSYAIKR